MGVEIPPNFNIYNNTNNNMEFRIPTKPERAERKSQLLSLKEGKVVLRGIADGATPKAWVQPQFDAATRWYYGVARLSEEQKKQTQYYVDPEDGDNPLSKVMLSNNISYDLSIPTDRLILEWLLEVNRVAMDYESAIHDSTRCTYYVYNEVAEKKKKLNSYEIKDKAVELIKNSPIDLLTKAARLAGLGISGLPAEDQRLEMRERVENQSTGKTFARELCEIFDDPRFEFKSFIFSAIDMGIIKKIQDEYKFGDIFLGVSLEAMISYLSQTNNNDLVSQIRDKMGFFPQDVTEKSKAKYAANKKS